VYIEIAPNYTIYEEKVKQFLGFLLRQELCRIYVQITLITTGFHVNFKTTEGKSIALI